MQYSENYLNDMLDFAITYHNNDDNEKKSIPNKLPDVDHALSYFINALEHETTLALKASLFACLCSLLSNQELPTKAERSGFPPFFFFLELSSSSAPERSLLVPSTVDLSLVFFQLNKSQIHALLLRCSRPYYYLGLWVSPPPPVGRTIRRRYR